MERNKREEEIAKKAFSLGIMFNQIKSGQVVSGTMPETYNEALEYVLKYCVDNNIDNECLSCGRYMR